MLRKEEKVPLMLCVLPTGSDACPRYRIHDQYNRMWTGEEFSPDEDEALAYEINRDAAQACQNILMIDAKTMPVHRTYVVPITIDLYSEKEVPMKALMDWLSRSALLIHPPSFGNGPVAGSVGITLVDWNLLKKV